MIHLDVYFDIDLKFILNLNFLIKHYWKANTRVKNDSFQLVFIFMKALA